MRRVLPTLGVVCAVTLAPLRSAGAQQTPVHAGDWVRLTRVGNSTRVVGRVLDADSTLFSLRLPHDDAPLQFHYAELRGLERRTGRRSIAASTLRGAGRGALVGLGAGVLLTVGTRLSGADAQCNDCFISATAAAAIAGVALTIAGTTVGAVVGAVHRPEIWRPVVLPSVSLAPPPARRALALGLNVHF